MSCSTGRQSPNQLATLTAHATQLQTRLLVALDTLDSQNLAHASEIASLQESYDKLAARARRLEYERNAANDDLAEMTAVLELVIEKVSAANDYKVLAHSDLRLPLPLSPPRVHPGVPSSRRSKADSPSDSSAYTTALVSALTTQLDVVRSQASRDRAEAERKISRLESMIELREAELKRNMKKVIASESADSGTESSTSSRMSRGEAIAAYEGVAKDNERLEKEVTRLKAELAAAEFNRATSEIRTSSSWAQLPDWARPQPVASSSKSKGTSPQPYIHSESSDRAPSSMSEPQASPRFLPALQREDSSASDPTPQRPGPSQPRARSSASTSDYRARSRASRPTVTVSDSNSDDSRMTLPQPSTKPKRSALRDSGIGVDSGSEATSSKLKAKSGKDRRSVESPRPKAEQDQESTGPRGQDLMPLLPALTPSKVRAPRVEVVELPSTSYVEPSFGISLRKRGERARPDSRETSRTAVPDLLSPGLAEPALGPTSSPRAISPVGELLLPPSVVSREDPPAPAELPVEPIPVLQPPAILQPAPILHSALPHTEQRSRSSSRSRSRSRTARLSPLPPVFDLTGLPAYESLPAATSAPPLKSSPLQSRNSPAPIIDRSPEYLAAPTDSPIRRQSDPAPTTQTEPPLVRPRSNSVAPSTPPRSTNNTAQFAFITPIHESVEAPSAAAAAAVTSTAVEPGTILGINPNSTVGGTTMAETAPNTSKPTAGGRKLLPMFKFMSPSPATPPSTKKRRMTAPSQLSNSTGLGASPKHGIASSPLVRGKPVRESPLQLVLGSAHAARRAEMRAPIMREVGASGFIPPIIPTVPLNPLVAQLVPPPPQHLPKLEFPPGTSPETQNVLRGMQAERALLDQAQPTQQDITPEQMAHVLLIEAECIRLRRNSEEAAVLRQEVELLRARLREQEQQQDYTMTTSTTDVLDTYSEGGMSDDTATEATIPEAGDTARRRMEYVERDLRSSMDSKDRSMSDLRSRMDDL
ncbi:unnamed protein product [Rhizoctonia solani]|uniref:Uncharacterized protein n=1 Tax=Rhizoctonia solani TaxID=456999 RepID=A0A8H3C7C8_9AGAM|nr:unnamed protein product [Rhizoctonia solani]